MFSKSLHDMLSAALEKSYGATSAPSPGEVKAVPLAKGLIEACGGNSAKAQMIMDGTVIPTLKALGTTNIGALRLVSVSDRIPRKANPDTKFLNWLETKEAAQIDDYQYRILEEDIGSDEASVVSLERTTVFPEVNTSFGARYNTLTCLGNTVSSSVIAQDIAMRQRGVNLIEKQVDAHLIRMRRKMNAMLLANVEKVTEGPTNAPELGGFLTRSTSNAQNAGGSNFTHTLLQTGINTIEEALGEGRELMLWGGSGQLPVVRDLMINRYTGEGSSDHRMLMDELRREALAAAGLPTQVVYEGYPGGAIPYIFDRQMPANTAVLFDASLPRLARFLLEGQQGPYVVALQEPNSAMYNLVAVFDLFTLDDPLQVSRVKYTNLAS